MDIDPFGVYRCPWILNRIMKTARQKDIEKQVHSFPVSVRARACVRVRVGRGEGGSFRCRTCVGLTWVVLVLLSPYAALPRASENLDAAWRELPLFKFHSRRISYGLLGRAVRSKRKICSRERLACLVFFLLC